MAGILFEAAGRLMSIEFDPVGGAISLEKLNARLFVLVPDFVNCSKSLGNSTVRADQIENIIARFVR
jgi:hypothetical protein